MCGGRFEFVLGFLPISHFGGGCQVGAGAATGSLRPSIGGCGHDRLADGVHVERQAHPAQRLDLLRFDLPAGQLGQLIGCQKHRHCHIPPSLPCFRVLPALAEQLLLARWRRFLGHGAPALVRHPAPLDHRRVNGAAVAALVFAFGLLAHACSP
jgi:hypothetical protein